MFIGCVTCWKEIPLNIICEDFTTFLRIKRLWNPTGNPHKFSSLHDTLVLWQQYFQCEIISFLWEILLSRSYIVMFSYEWHWDVENGSKKKTEKLSHFQMYHEQRRYRERQRAITLTPGISRLLIFLLCYFSHLDTFFPFSARLIFVLTAQKNARIEIDTFHSVWTNYVIAIFVNVCRIYVNIRA